MLAFVPLTQSHSSHSSLVGDVSTAQSGKGSLDVANLELDPGLSAPRQELFCLCSVVSSTIGSKHNQQEREVGIRVNLVLGASEMGHGQWY